MGGAGDQQGIGSRFGGRCRQGVTHLPRTVIGDVAHRIQCLAGGAGGNDHLFAVQQAGVEQRRQARQQIGGFQHPARSRVAACLNALGGPQDHKIPFSKSPEVILSALFAPHALVHRRSQGDGCGGGECNGGQQITGFPLPQPGQKIRRGRGHQQQVSPSGQLDVAHAGLGLGVQQLRVHRVPG